MAQQTFARSGGRMTRVCDGRARGLLSVAMVVLLVVGMLLPAYATEPTAVRHVSSSEAQALLSSQRQLVLLDIRTPKEFAAGHLDGAINIDFLADDFAQRLNALDKDATYLIYCRSGRRSSSALPLFEQLEFRSIYHLAGGLRRWLADGQPIGASVDYP